jgi:CubicO group peptidase (beta-lactamase class C family)
MSARGKSGTASPGAASPGMASTTGRTIAAVILGAVALRVVFLLAQPQAPPLLDARASDPTAMGWMVGSPPPAEKLIRFSDASFYRFPQTRWAFSHMRELVPTASVSRGDGPVIALPRSERTDLDAVTFTPIGGARPVTWAQSLAANYTDGIVILHRGRIVYERYFGALTPERQHIAFSVTKSFVATLAATLIAEGTLDERATVARYLPELRSSGFGDATIRQLLDMTTGIDYSEDYADEGSPVWNLGRAVGFLPRPPGSTGAASGYEYLASLRKAEAHGEKFVYKTPNTDVLGWVLRRLTGKPLSEWLGERIFSRIGAEQDAYFLVDPTGVEFAGGGLHLTLRDLARFGELMRMGGRFNGQQVVPAAVIDDIRAGGDRERFARTGYKMLPGWSYRTMWWVSHNAHGAYSARGIHGQAIYVDPAAEMVVARFASHPLGANANLDPMSLPAYDAVARHLMTGR